MDPHDVPQICTSEIHSLIHWEETAASACVPLKISGTPATGVQGTIAHALLGEACLSRITAVGHVADHDRRSVSQTHGDYVLACFQLSGNGELVQDERRARVGPSDIVLFESARPFRWAFNEPFDQFILRLPRASFRSRSSAGVNPVATTFSGKCGMGRIAADFIGSLWTQNQHLTDATLARQVGESAADLLGFVVADLARSAPGSNTPSNEVLFRQAIQIMNREMHDYDLCPESIARALGISLRYLHRLFAARENTVVRTLMELRLERSATWLTDSRCAHKSIEQIAAECGFKNASHFSRLFRTRYTESPRQFRLAVRNSPARYPAIHHPTQKRGHEDALAQVPV